MLANLANCFSFMRARPMRKWWKFFRVIFSTLPTTGIHYLTVPRMSQTGFEWRNNPNRCPIHVPNSERQVTSKFQPILGAKLIKNIKKMIENKLVRAYSTYFPFPLITSGSDCINTPPLNGIDWLPHSWANHRQNGPKWQPKMPIEYSQDLDQTRMRKRGRIFNLRRQ
jgi:hypothetical protein